MPQLHRECTTHTHLLNQRQHQYTVCTAAATPVRCPYTQRFMNTVQAMFLCPFRLCMCPLRYCMCPLRYCMCPDCRGRSEAQLQALVLHTAALPDSQGRGRPSLGVCGEPDTDVLHVLGHSVSREVPANVHIRSPLGSSVMVYCSDGIL